MKRVIFFVGFTLFFTKGLLASDINAEDVFIEHPDDIEYVKNFPFKSGLEARAFKWVQSALLEGVVVEPKQGTDFYVFCLENEIKFVVGMGNGACVLFSVSSESLVRFRAASNYMFSVGAATALISAESQVRVTGVESLNDLERSYFSSDSSFAVVAGAREGHQYDAVGKKTKYDKGVPEVEFVTDDGISFGWGINFVSVKLSKVDIYEDSPTHYFYNFID